MKTRFGRFRPYSYKNSMLFTLLMCVLVCGFFSFGTSYAVSRRNVLQEIRAEQNRTAISMLSLGKHSGDIASDEICEMFSSEEVKVTTVQPEELSSEILRGLTGVMPVVEVSHSLGKGPSTYLKLDGEIYSITVKKGRQVIRTALLRNAASVLMYAASFIMLSMLISRYMSAPIVQLTKATHLISQGDYSVRVPADEYTGEICELLSSFNAMTAELEKTDYLQRDFISSISHEFKTPIASIKGYARLLQMPGLTDAERSEYVQIIAQESDRLSRMSQTLLRLTSLEQQTTPASRKAFRLDEQLREVIVSMSAAWESQEIEWDLDLNPVVIHSDEELLRQVWVNLLQNAVKFSEKGTKIAVSTRDEKGAMVVIADQGIGMDPETLSRIFDKFYQADPSRSREGIGLGLSLCRRIVNILGGEIKAASEVGKGSTFTVRLPYDGIPMTAEGKQKHGRAS